ncbi:MAG: YhcN/YlaJ family sporulation lipoprotein [Bacilli bacterium]
MIKKGSVFLTSVLIAASLAGCTANRDANPNTYGTNANNYGLNNTNRVLTYDQDGYNGFRNANPNMRIGRQTDVNYGTETRRMATAAERVRGVDDATVVITGGTAYVGLDIESEYRGNPEQVEREVYRVVSRMMPRYDIRITSDRGSFKQLRNLGEGFNRDRRNR